MYRQWLVCCLLIGLAGCADGLREADPARSAAIIESASSSATVPDPAGTDLPPRRPSRQQDPGDARVTAAVDAALGAAGRTTADKSLDVRRRSGDVLKFIGIAPGMTVLDLWSGGGYYTELLARLVGSDGRVVAHNDDAYLRHARAEADRRFAAGRLPNVERLTAEAAALELPAARFDAVLIIQAWHDLYLPADRVAAERTRSRILAEVFSALKPGGVLGVVDHAAVAGSPTAEAAELHRVDEERVRREFAAAGFLFEAASDALRNPADSRLTSVFDPAVRGRTDQFILRFRRPGKPAG